MEEVYAPQVQAQPGRALYFPLVDHIDHICPPQVLTCRYTIRLPNQVSRDVDLFEVPALLLWLRTSIGGGMKVHATILSFALLLAAPLLAREKNDVLVMKNGDRLTAEVKGLDEGVLYVSFDYILGTSSVQWSKVAYIESKQLFIVRTE